MNARRRLTVSLPEDMARMIQEKVQSGTYASDSEVVDDALRNLQAHDTAVEKWLRQEAVPAYDAYIAAPSEVISIDDVFDGAGARYRARKAKSG